MFNKRVLHYWISNWISCTTNRSMRLEAIKLLSKLKMLLAVRNGDFTLPHLSSSEIECLITDIATM